jgi:nicotinamide-nucleotide amidase
MVELSAMEPTLTGKAAETIEYCAAAGLTLATAESCTGGLVAAALTAIPGSSAVVERGFVTYSNRAKTEMLGVPAEVIAAEGAVSEAVARAMAEGALAHSQADIAVAITGIAGPTGATPGKPVGLVHLACARRGATTRHSREVFAGDRDAVRLQAAMAALGMIALPPAARG